MKHMVLIFILLAFVACSNSEEVVVFETANTSLEDSNETRIFLEESPSSRPLIQISADDPLQIMVRADGAPGMYLGEDGEVHGFYVDLERTIMNEMGQAYEFVAYTDVGPVVQGMKDGSMHLTLATPDMPDYRAMANMSDPFEILHYVVFLRADETRIGGETKDELIQSLFGKTVGVQTQGHIYQVLREYKEITLLEYPTTTKALEALSSGILDAVPDVKRIGHYYAKKEGWDIKSVGAPIISQKICTGFSQMLEPELVARYNEALSAVLADGRYEKLYTSYYGILDDSSRP